MKKLLLVSLAVATLMFNYACSNDDEGETVEKITFSDLTLAVDTFWNGSTGSGRFTSGIATFSNEYTTSQWGASWNGFAYSNQNDTSTSGYAHQFDVYTATKNTNGVFAVSFVSDSSKITFTESVNLRTADFALNAYAYKSMKNGDSFAKKFTAGDWYKITVTGFDANNVKLAEVDVYLADFRDGKSILVNNWSSFDLSALGSVKSVTFAASSSDVGQWGMNTPGYFCIDNISYVK